MKFWAIISTGLFLFNHVILIYIYPNAQSNLSDWDKYYNAKMIIYDLVFFLFFLTVFIKHRLLVLYVGLCMSLLSFYEKIFDENYINTYDYVLLYYLFVFILYLSYKHKVNVL